MDQKTIKTTKRTIPIPDGVDSESILLELISGFNDNPYLCALYGPIPKQFSNNSTSSDYPYNYYQFEWIFGAGKNVWTQPTKTITNSNSNFQDFEELCSNNPKYRMGFFPFEHKSVHKQTAAHEQHDLKNQIHRATWFEADVFLKCKGKEIIIENDAHNIIENMLLQIFSKTTRNKATNPTSRTVSNKALLKDILKCNTTKKEYLSNVNKIKELIRDGILYELNYCIEWSGVHPIKDPENLWLRMVRHSQAPFSAFMRLEDQYILSTSPERFLSKNGALVIAQPIKGTSKRKKQKHSDRIQFKKLSESIKEIAEHVMIVDLIRNDLAKCLDPISIRVAELFKVCAFQTVHQMISTIEGNCSENFSINGLLESTFPPGSMTGAPKESVCIHIPKLEKATRGIYSGCLGYIEPSYTCDLSVVIRTLTYNKKNKNISVKTGSAITWDSTPQDEWEECKIKIESILKQEID